MSDANFPVCLQAILKEEGGNDDDPNDHGGRTSRGVIQREWDVWRKSHPGLPEDVWQAPQAQIDEIYREQYWLPLCPELPSGLDLEFFDFSVNSGRSQAVRTLQRALGVTPDGMLGITTKQAISDADLPNLIQKYAAKRLEFYQSLAQFSRFGKGWSARTNRIENTAMMLARNVPVTHPSIDTIPARPDITVSPKADPRDVAQPPIGANTASAGTIAGTVGTAVSDQLQQAGTALQPLADTFVWIKYACIAITVVCAGFAIYAVLKNRRTAAVV